MPRRRLRYYHLALGLAAVLLFLAAGPLRLFQSSGATLGARSLQISDSSKSAVANYVLSLSGQTAGIVGSIRAQFCSNDALIGLPCTAPSGFDISGATLTAQSGMGSFSISPATTANVMILTRTPGPSVPGTSSFTFSGVTNPDTEGSYYVKLETYATNDASGPHTDYGGIAFAINNPISISTKVPPYLLFCVATTIPGYSCDQASGDFIDFGELNSQSTATGQTQMLAATNADNGYSIRVIGTSLTSGNNVIPPLTSTDFSRTGTSQFGLNLVANATPPVGTVVQGPGSAAVAADYNTPDEYRFVSGETVASSLVPDSYRLFTASYIVNISKSQPAGVYTSTITYVGLANF